MILLAYQWLRKIINACGDEISLSLKSERCFVLSEIVIEMDCEDLEKKVAEEYVLKTRKCLKYLKELEAMATFYYY